MNISLAVRQSIYILRGQRIMLSTDLAELYGVPPRALIQAVKRNSERFPQDFMFQLTIAEADRSRSQIVTLKRGQNIKHPPYAFTEQGVAMLSSVLRSQRAIQVNIAIMRTFVALRGLLSLRKDLSFKLARLEKRIEGHDTEIQNIFEALRELMTAPAEPRRRIGFQAPKNS
ncbi:MAG: ORF6N domain-containing protein [Elusimicrobiota bacterium]|jgi:hypothetical protein